MKRLAAHFIVVSPEETYALHYVELDEESRLQGIFPMEKEIASTAFYNGTIFLTNLQEIPESFDWQSNRLDPDKPVFAFHFDSGIPPAEFGASNSGSYSYIQRI